MKEMSVFTEVYELFHGMDVKTDESASATRNGHAVGDISADGPRSFRLPTMAEFTMLFILLWPALHDGEVGGWGYNWI